MAKIRHLGRAPIAEAVIELRVRPQTTLTLETLQQLSQRWKERYPVQQKLQSVAATFGIQGGKPLPSDSRVEQLGFLLKTEDQLDVVQFQTGAFAFSRLQPYTSWEQVLPEALKAWQDYRNSTRPDRLIRIGVRYINRFNLRLPVDLRTYLTTVPPVPEMMPAVLRSYLTRTVLHDAETGNSVTVTQASEPAANEGHLIVLLDVDAFRDVDLEPSEPRLESLLESLRDLKNQAFFGCITDQTVESYT